MIFAQQKRVEIFKLFGEGAFHRFIGNIEL
jgi:hypothetical protein